MVIVLLGPSGAGKSEIRKNLVALHNTAIVESPIRQFISQGVLPDPRVETDVASQAIFQHGLLSLLYTWQHRNTLLSGALHDKHTHLVLDRGFGETLVYWELRFGEKNPFHEEILNKFSEMIDIAVYVKPHANSQPAGFVPTSDYAAEVELYEKFFQELQSLTTTYEIKSEAITDRVAEVSSLIELSREG